jgi:hypothetical protein
MSEHFIKITACLFRPDETRPGPFTEHFINARYVQEISQSGMGTLVDVVGCDELVRYLAKESPKEILKLIAGRRP